MTLFRNPPGLVGAAALICTALTACDIDPAGLPPFNSPRDQAYRAWQEACPDYSGEGGLVLQSRSVRDGDLGAIDCEIKYLRAQMTPYTEAELDWWRDLTGEERHQDTRLEEYDLFQLLYVRWRLTGEGLEELEAHAGTMPKAEIDGALALISFDDDVLPQARRDLCGRVAEDDPGFRFVMLGRGERDPASCGPAIMDGRGAG